VVPGSTTILPLSTWVIVSSEITYCWRVPGGGNRNIKSRPRNSQCVEAFYSDEVARVFFTTYLPVGQYYHSLPMNDRQYLVVCDQGIPQRSLGVLQILPSVAGPVLFLNHSRLQTVETETTGGLYAWSFVIQVKCQGPPDSKGNLLTCIPEANHCYRIRQYTSHMEDNVAIILADSNMGMVLLWQIEFDNDLLPSDDAIDLSCPSCQSMAPSS
jgi:hypothetical protein